MRSRTLEPLLHSLYRFGTLHGGDSRTDADLLERFNQTRDEAAFAALVHRHGPMVLASCQRLLADRHEAEDAFQATFLVLVHKSAALRQPQLLAPWLHKVALRIALRLRNKAARRRTIPEDLDIAETQGPEPLDRLAWQEVRTILDEEIERLPSKYRLPVVLCYLQGQSYSEAARSLGWPTGTVAVRLARARQKLRARFIRRGLGLSVSLPGIVLAQEALASPVPAVLCKVTVNAGVCAAAGPSTLAGVVSQQVTALVEGALQTMWMTKSKMTLFLMLMAGLVCTGLGGLAWHQSAQAQAQAPIPFGGAKPARTRPAEEQEGGKEAEDVEKQLRALQQQVQEKQAQLARLRQGNALDQIEAAIKKLQQANATNPQRVSAVQEFAAAFGKLKQELAGKTASPARNRFGGGAGGFGGSSPYAGGPIVEGRVLQVDLQNKQVLLSGGSKDGIKKGRLYRVYQGSKGMPDQTGWIRITSVDSKWSTATILLEFSPRAPMRPNDIIQLHDGKEPEGLGGGGAAGP